MSTSILHLFFFTCFLLLKMHYLGSYSWMSHRTFIESSAVTTAFWLDQYGGRFASIFRRCPPSMFWGQWCKPVLSLPRPDRLVFSTGHNITREYWCIIKMYYMSLTMLACMRQFNTAERCGQQQQKIVHVYQHCVCVCVGVCFALFCFVFLEK